MLAFNELGNNGRLGNQMFQYAALRGIASKKGYDFCIHPFSAPRLDNYSLHKCFKLSNVVNKGFLDNGFPPIVVENQFHYDEDLHNLCPNDVSLHGFFQTEKYFLHISDSIREDFSFYNEILDPCKEMISGLENPIFCYF